MVNTRKLKNFLILNLYQNLIFLGKGFEMEELIGEKIKYQYQGGSCNEEKGYSEKDTVDLNTKQEKKIIFPLKCVQNG